jgi:S1-C subfamily serine protease
MIHVRRASRVTLAACFLCALLQSVVSYAQTAASAGPAAGQTAAAKATEPSASARDLFLRYKDRLLQVRVLLASASEQSALGSGFVVRNEGAQGALVVTNYHVVSSLAVEPQKYRIELRGTNERKVNAKLVAVDVVHDLAVLRTEPAAGDPAWTAFELRDTPLVQGSKVYALGNPLELGFLIAEGIYNGRVESRIYEQMLFSGALNSGMSGGPAIDEAGRVVGVNVATRRDGSLLSFLVPVRYMRELLARAGQAQPPGEWRSALAGQLRGHQDFVAGKLLGGASNGVPAAARAPAADRGGKAAADAGFASQTLAGRTVPTLDGSLTKCWANGLTGEKLRYHRDSLDCSLRSELFVSRGLSTGSLSLQHVVLRNDKLPTVKFLNIASGARSLGVVSAGNDNISRSECHDSYVQGSQHVYRVGICVRAYRKFEGLYDYNVQAIQVDDAQERLSSSLHLRGFSFENAQQLATLFLERLQ